jgi:hypothetical protein
VNPRTVPERPEKLRGRQKKERHVGPDKRIGDEPGTHEQRAEIQDRREALKKFGRYAAVAPTAMLLLASRQSEAGPPPWVPGPPPWVPGPPPSVPPPHAGGYD